MIGQTISHYRILEKLGEGGMGVVYKAQDTKLDRFVALKFLPHHLTANEAEKARFLQEAKAASALNHPNVCTVYGIDEFKGQQYIEMEYVDGETLRQKIPVKKIEDSLRIAVQIGEALGEAHAMGIVHRDIKAENIMVNSKGQIKVMDFGLAKLKGTLKLTRTSSTIGTLAYMAPEQIQGGEVDARSDIFSFGVVLFELLTGKLPFPAEHEAAIMYSIVNEEPVEITTLRHDLPPGLSHIISKSLEKDPQERYQSVADMVVDLRRSQKRSTRVVMDRPPAAAAVATPKQSPPEGLNKFIWIAAALIIAAALGSYFLFFNKSPRIESLAVLPFVNSAMDSGTDYLSDGITESMINSLTRIPGLRVIPRSTVFRFKGKDIDPQEVGTKLNVAAVLTGRLIQRGDELSIQLDLIDVRSQAQVWGSHYNCRSSDLLSVQDNILNDVTPYLDKSLSGETRKNVIKRSTENVEAYKLYLQGRYYWNKRSAASLERATDYFKEAIAADPTYALAYGGLADCYLLMEQYAGLPAKETVPKATAAAGKALELDNSLAEIHTSLAMCKSFEWNWDGAEQEFKRSIQLNPNYATAYHWYSLLLHDRGRHDEALKIILRAQELDPLSLVIGINVGIGYLQLGEHDKAAREFQNVLAMDSTFAPVYRMQGLLNLRKKTPEAALPWFSKAVDYSGRSSESLGDLAFCLGHLERREKAMALIHELEERYKNNVTPAYYIAKAYAGLSDRTKVFDYLEKDFQNHSGVISQLGYDQAWIPFRSDPQFVELLKKLGLRL